MKKSKLRLLLLFIGLVAIAGTTLFSCKDDNDDDDDNAVHVWECKTNNNTTLTLTMYPKEGKYYSIVSDTIHENYNIYFGDSCWSYFYMVDDTTMYVTKGGNDSLGWDSYGDHPIKWSILKSNNKMKMVHYGRINCSNVEAGLAQNEYEFNLKK